MAEGPLTLRGLGEEASRAAQSLEDAIASAKATVQNDPLLDWPLWLVGLAAVAFLLLLRPALLVAADVAGALADAFRSLPRVFRTLDPGPPFSAIDDAKAFARSSIRLLSGQKGADQAPRFPDNPEDVRLWEEARGPYSDDPAERLR